MDQTIIERYLQQPGTYLRCVICGRGVIAASIIYRGDNIATGRGTSLAAALDALAQALTARAA